MTIKDYVQNRKDEIKNLVASLTEKPSIAIVQVNEDAGSNAYVKGKLKDAEQLGIKAELIKLDITTSQADLLKVIARLNNDPAYDGFIVQMPLPKGIDEELVKLAISPEKDVDGFHPLSSLVACTPQGILNYLKHKNIPLEGKNAVVIGRSNIVGKPMAKLLLKENMNVTVLHSRTSPEDMAFYIAHAELIVIAIGKTAFLDNRFTYKKEAVIVDVGINRTEEGLVGDALKNLPVKLQTPVPGGVGLLTRLALYENLLKIKDING
ncbi:MAG: bifunctional 5,10-methylenetetrahydrofolate dehydrogenase/5,10-methenyltetrahydrofolate cyclohydrolase [Erysipelotrichia bacterium]|nr:bifunctional 5,10-methylenetetrahydrofolate dehydrogenase/5,10-methenyltetrahydrofolate cyclohydrolase [Erysipelotrichia bacterium]